MKERLIYVDAIKGMLILLVIIGHFGLAKSTPTILHDIIYSFHMPLFIFLSGYVIESITFQKLITRIRKLLVPFFIIGTTYSYCVGDTMTWLLKDTKLYFWYLLVLAYCLVVVYILHKISDKWRNYRSLSVMLGGGHFYNSVFCIK